MSRTRLTTLVGLLLLLLGGCYLASGERVENVTMEPEGSGQLVSSFVQADGSAYREVMTGIFSGRVLLEVDVLVDEGELTLQVYNSDGMLALTVQSVWGSPGQGSVVVFSGASGQVPFRLQAAEARNGSYTIRYTAPPRPGRTPTPTPEP